jgi:phage terminase Nu1 subunit (DNA packaging protein)
MRVNKSELAQILGLSLPTVSAYMVRYGEAFPVLERGGRGRDWWFESDAVTAFLDARKAEDEAGDAERQAALAQLTLPIGHNGGPDLEAEPELSPAELLTMWKVRRIQREEAYARGRLVEAHKVKSTVEGLLSDINRSLRLTVRRFGRENGLSSDLTDALDEAVKQCQRDLVAYRRSMDAPADAQPSLFQAAAE